MQGDEGIEVIPEPTAKQKPADREEDLQGRVKVGDLYLFRGTLGAPPTKRIIAVPTEAQTANLLLTA